MRCEERIHSAFDGGFCRPRHEPRRSALAASFDRLPPKNALSKSFLFSGSCDTFLLQCYRLTNSPCTTHVHSCILTTIHVRIHRLPPPYLVSLFARCVRCTTTFQCYLCLPARYIYIIYLFINTTVSIVLRFAKSRISFLEIIYLDMSSLQICHDHEFKESLNWPHRYKCCLLVCNLNQCLPIKVFIEEACKRR